MGGGGGRKGGRGGTAFSLQPELSVKKSPLAEKNQNFSLLKDRAPDRLHGPKHAPLVDQEIEGLAYRVQGFSAGRLRPGFGEGGMGREAAVDGTAWGDCDAPGYEEGNMGGPDEEDGLLAEMLGRRGC